MKYLRGELGERRFEEVNGGSIELRFLQGIVRYANATSSALPSPPWQLRLAAAAVEDGDSGRSRTRVS